MSKKPHVTRQTTDRPVIGQPIDVSEFNVLPTKMDVLKYFEWVRIEMKQEGIHQPAKKVIALRVALKLEEIWKRASIPVCGTKNTIFMVLKLHEQLEKIKKCSGPKRKYPNSYKDAVTSFQSKTETALFDICTCKCDLSNCICSIDKKVPALEHEFLLDQRGPRLMSIAECDKNETKKLKKRLERKSRSQALMQVVVKKTEDENLKSVDNIDSGDSTDDSMSHTSCQDSDFEINVLDTSQKSVSSVEVKQELPQRLSLFSRACDRRGISSRAGAQLATALLRDLNVVTAENQEAVIDKSKVARERLKSRKEVSSTRTSDLLAIYFDGRKDETITKEIVAGKSVRKSLKEEHISIVEEPGSKYFGHVTPINGTGKEIVTSLVKYCEEKTVDLKKLKAIGCDGTAANTGTSNGVITLFENKIQQPLQAVVCLLHLNELPFRKIMVALDGPTSGPNTFSGPIGKQLLSCQNLDVVNFVAIESDIPEVDLKELSTDQKYLYEISKAVSTGTCTEELARRNPGNISHARWLTLANRILRLYVAMDDPTPELRKLAEFIMKVYIPSWFSIKCNPKIPQGSINFFKMIHFSNYLEDELKHVVHATLQRNAFMAHPEHVLIAMLFDERKHIRVLAYKRIQKARETEKKGVRIFKPPQINFNAKDYIDMIDWQTTSVTEPPLVTDMSLEELQLIAETGKSGRVEFTIPSHTQAVERIVKEVTEASKRVCGMIERDGFIRARLEDRKELPTFETKSQYKTSVKD